MSDGDPKKDGCEPLPRAENEADVVLARTGESGDSSESSLNLVQVSPDGPDVDLSMVDEPAQGEVVPPALSDKSSTGDRLRFGPTVGQSELFQVHASGVQGSMNQVNAVGGDIHIHYREDREDPQLEEVGTRRSQLFHRSIEHRDEFVGRFLGQALRQANVTFILSVIFMAIGGLLVLAAGALALLQADRAQIDYLAIGTGLSGLVVTGSGAAYARRADKARKHLAEQAEKMHSQLLDERKFSQVGEILSGIQDPELNDRARISLALRIMNADPNLPEIPPKED